MSKEINELLALMREEGSKNVRPSFFMGVIVSGFPNLIINVSGAEFDKEDLKISKWLFDRCNININCTEGSINHYLPSFYKNYLDRDIQNAFEKEIDSSSEEIEDYLNQFFIDTATWGLNDWEELCRIKINSNLSYETRRANIKAKLRGRSTTTNKVLESICEAYTKRTASVDEYANDFLIVLNIIINVCPYETVVELDKFIETIKPCHLNHKFIMSLINKNKLNIGAVSLSGEELVVYPWSIKNIETKGKYNMAIGMVNGVEELSVYPEKKEVI